MKELSEVKKVSRVRVWLQAIRVFSFPASIVPVFVGAALVIYYERPAAWGLFPLAIVCSVLLNAGANLVCDYFDFIKGVDEDYTYGSSKVIVEGLLEPKQVLTGGLIMLAAGAVLGLVFVAVRGRPMLVIGAIGLAGCFFYGGRPLGLKYIALGDIMVFVLMGPLMVIGTFLALTGGYNNGVLLVSLPVGFLVAAILSANNLRDIKHDTEAGVKTIANILGHRGARLEYYALIVGAYTAVVIMLITAVLPTWSLLVFISVPLAIKNIKTVAKCPPQNTGSIASLDVQTAQLHLVFGVLLTASILVAAN